MCELDGGNLTVPVPEYYVDCL